MSHDAFTDIEIGSAREYPEQNDEQEYAPAEDIEIEKGFITKLQRFTGKYGVEQRGIEPVLEHERTDTTVLRLGMLVCIILFHHSFSRETMAALPFAILLQGFGSQVFGLINDGVLLTPFTYSGLRVISP